MPPFGYEKYKPVERESTESEKLSWKVGSKMSHLTAEVRDQRFNRKGLKKYFPSKFVTPKAYYEAEGLEPGCAVTAWLEEEGADTRVSLFMQVVRQDTKEPVSEPDLRLKGGVLEELEFFDIDAKALSESEKLRLFQNVFETLALIEAEVFAPVSS